MRPILLATIAAGTIAAMATPAAARQGCGGGFHRGPYGGCRPNVGRRVIGPAPVLVVGRYYPGRGYWYRNRYWANRYRWHGGWRYR